MTENNEIAAEELKNIIMPILEANDAQLVELNLLRTHSGLTLKLLVDKKTGGISLEQCAHLNKEIVRALDEKTILQQNYLLEVSSPGLDRPLTTKADFFRCLNKTVRIFLKEPLNGKWELEGAIGKVEDDLVCININGNIVNIPISIINRAKQVI